MCHFVATSSRPATASMRRSAWRVSAAATLTALALAGPAFALPPANADRGGDPAPKPLLAKPPLAARAGALPDTTALLPAGKYTMGLTLKQKTITGPVTITRSGGAVTASMNAAETLTGTLDPLGNLQLAGGSGSDSLRLAATVQNHRAAGSAQAGLGSTRLAGSFTLDPVTGARKPMQVWETDKGSPVAAPAAPTCNWWCGFRKWLGV